MNNSSFIKYKWNEKLIVQSTEFLVQSTKDFSFEWFNCGVKCNINNLSTYRIYAFSRLSQIHKALRYLGCSKMTHKKGGIQQPINAKSVAYVGNKSIQLKLLFLPLNILHSLEQLTII